LLAIKRLETDSAIRSVRPDRIGLLVDKPLPMASRAEGLGALFPAIAFAKATREGDPVRRLV
jgi:hypothetical protein